MVRSTIMLLVLMLASGWVAAANISAQGSDSNRHLIQALAVAFHAESGHKIKLSGGGSNSGADAVMSKDADLAFLSRDLKPSEISAGMSAVDYALDGVAVIVHRENQLSSVSTENLRALLSGDQKNWVDGRRVVVFNRDSSSATRELIQEKILEGTEFSPVASEKHGRIILNSVSRIPNAIGFVSVGELDDRVKALEINGLKANAINIQEGNYPISRPLKLATLGEATGVSKAFIEFVKSEKGSSIISESGYGLPDRESKDKEYYNVHAKR